MEILDIHTHHLAPQAEGVVSVGITDDFSMESLLANQLYSVGIHPWELGAGASVGTEALRKLEECAKLPNVVAIGEAGVDLLKGGVMFRQLNIFRKHVELSEWLGKPLIVHDVKSDDIICGLRRDLNPKQPWCIHGYRGKPAGAAALLKAGCWLSFGENFNPETLKSTPLNRLLAETDESKLTIQQIISALSEVVGCDLTDQIKVNSLKFCNFADGAYSS